MTILRKKILSNLYWNIKIKNFAARVVTGAGKYEHINNVQDPFFWVSIIVFIFFNGLSPD